MSENTTPTPKTHAEVADKIMSENFTDASGWRQLRDAIATALREASTSITVDGVVYGENMIRLLQQQANECRAAGYIDDAGNVRRVLGKLPVTADGAIIGSMGEVWREDANWRTMNRPRFYKHAQYSAKVDDPTPTFATEEAAREHYEKHNWFDSGMLKGVLSCKRCGLVQRADGNNKPCVGKVQVGLRSKQPLHAKDAHAGE
jgi:hypothetical protein